MPRGGRRPGAGGPKGPRPQTLVKLRALEELRRMVVAELKPMVTAQIRAATGLSYCFVRDADGNFKRATSPKQIEQALNSGNPAAFYIDVKDPSTAAFTDLINRALDKPIERIETEHVGRGEFHVFHHYAIPEPTPKALPAVTVTRVENDGQ